MIPSPITGILPPVLAVHVVVNTITGLVIEEHVGGVVTVMLSPPPLGSTQCFQRNSKRAIIYANVRTVFNVLVIIGTAVLELKITGRCPFRCCPRGKKAL